jgi:hypothetical protein
MADKDQAVRDAAAALKTAIAEAVADCYRVHWPGGADDLDKIAVSATGNVKAPEPVTRKPTSTLSRPLPPEKNPV